MCDRISSGSPEATGAPLEVLYRSAAGSLSLCPGCRTFGLTFGSLHLSLDSEAILAFHQLLDRLSGTRLKAGQCHMVRLGCTPATLLLSPSELSDLRRIVLQGHQAALGVQAGIAAIPKSLGAETWVH